MKRENTRQDIVTRKPFPRKDLLRLVVVAGVVTPDKDSCLPGRGYYLARREGILEEGIKKHVFERRFHRPLTPEEIAAIKEAL